MAGRAGLRCRRRTPDRIGPPCSLAHSRIPTAGPPAAPATAPPPPTDGAGSWPAMGWTDRTGPRPSALAAESGGRAQSQRETCCSPRCAVPRRTASFPRKPAASACGQHRTSSGEAPDRAACAESPRSMRRQQLREGRGGGRGEITATPRQLRLRSNSTHPSHLPAHPRSSRCANNEKKNPLLHAISTPCCGAKACRRHRRWRAACTTVIGGTARESALFVATTTTTTPRRRRARSVTCPPPARRAEEGITAG